MLMLGQAHLGHPAKQDLAWAVGGGWAVSPAAHWIANMGSAKPGWWGAAAQTGAGGWPGTGLTRPGPFGLVRPCASRVANAPLV